jgi:DNA-binding MarR family transcriptional regulator
VSDLNITANKSSSLLYLRDDKIKLSLYEFFSINKFFEKAILSKIEKTNLGIADIKCLLLINLNPGITFNELMVNLDITKQSLNRVLKVLIKKNFILQKTNTQDARKKNLHLTDSANTMLNKILKPSIEKLSSAFLKSGINSVQGLNQILSNLISMK